ncbi:MAG: ABC transporter permease [Thermodesulfobacteriota bacterium]|nr:ABC transporter permease [Thermodesulfobacteriota bacterium]
MIKSFFFHIGTITIHIVKEMGEIFLLFTNAMSWLVRPPLRLRNIFKEMEKVGVNSTFVVLLTGTFTGMVLALQSYYAFRKFGGESLMGATVALSMTRELGPVLTALMVTARSGSAMTAEIGTMRVTEQIDALSSMAINPVQFLVLPKIIASVLVLPLLTIICDFTGILGGYFVGVNLLKINSGIYIAWTVEYVDIYDIFNGLYKALFFGLILSLIGCYKGFYTSGGAEGVGKATTQSVVLSCILILVGDYILTSFLF